MQQQAQMIPMMPTSIPSTSITTEQVQKYLDENKKLIMAILDNQNLGKLAECAQYQAQLQKNLMYLAAIADAQPQPPSMPHQMSPHPVMQQGAYFMQHPQAAAVAMAQQSGVFPQKAAMQFNNPPNAVQQQQHHVFQVQMGGARPGGANAMHPETAHGGGTKQDTPEAGPNDGQERSAPGHGGSDLKGPEDGK